MQESHDTLSAQAGVLSKQVEELKEQVTLLQTSVTSAEQQVADLKEQLAAETEANKANQEIVEKQKEELQVLLGGSADTTQHMVCQHVHADNFLLKFTQKEGLMLVAFSYKAGTDRAEGCRCCSQDRLGFSCSGASHRSCSIFCSRCLIAHCDTRRLWSIQCSSHQPCLTAWLKSVTAYTHLFLLTPHCLVMSSANKTHTPHAMQAAEEASASAKSTAEQAEAAAAASKSAEEEAVSAREAAEGEVARLQPLLEEAKRSQERAQEQQHNAEQTLSVKQVRN